MGVPKLELGYEWQKGKMLVFIRCKGRWSDLDSFSEIPFMPFSSVALALRQVKMSGWRESD